MFQILKFFDSEKVRNLCARSRSWKRSCVYPVGTGLFDVTKVHRSKKLELINCDICQMAQHAVVATKLNVKMSGSAVSTAPSHVQKKVRRQMDGH